MSERLRPLARLALVALLLALGSAARAQQPDSVGVVVQYADGTVSTHCVAYAGEGMTGLDALLATGLDAVYEGGSLGARVCKIGPDGCDSPTDCFCQCKGTQCLYWSYWHQVEGAWRYSIIGASSYRVQPGTLEGWSWGIGTPNNAPAPPALAYEAVCPRPEGTAGTEAPPTQTPAPATPAPTATPSRTAGVPAVTPESPTPTVAQTPSPAAPPAARPTATAPAVPTVAPPDTAPTSQTGGYLAFAGILLALAAVAAIVVLRRRR